MHRIDNASSVAIKPAPAPDGPNPGSYFKTDTIVERDWANQVQEEISNVIEGFGDPLDKSIDNQLFSVVSSAILGVGSKRQSVIQASRSVDGLPDYLIGNVGANIVTIKSSVVPVVYSFANGIGLPSNYIIRVQNDVDVPIPVDIEGAAILYVEYDSELRTLSYGIRKNYGNTDPNYLPAPPPEGSRLSRAGHFDLNAMLNYEDDDEGGTGIHLVNWVQKHRVYLAFLTIGSGLIDSLTTYAINGIAHFEEQDVQPSTDYAYYHAVHESSGVTASVSGDHTQGLALGLVTTGSIGGVVNVHTDSTYDGTYFSVTVERTF